MKNLGFATWCFLLVSLIGVIFGVVDLFTPRILPYHERYLAMTHEELDPQFASLFLSALRIIGVLLISQSLVLGVLAYQLDRKYENWRWYLLAVVWPATLATIMILMIRIGLFTPWWIVAGLLALTLLALYSSRPSKQSE
ncbi:MAG TPA: hypothetical protein VGA00_09925 [Acidiferrobacterales bacterium]